MAEYFQQRKSDPPTFHVPTDFPKWLYGGNPHTDSAELKAALENNLVKRKLVHTQEEQDRLLSKGWVLAPAELLEEESTVERKDVDGEPEFELIIAKRRKKEAVSADAVSEDPEMLSGANKTPSPRSRRTAGE